MTRPLVCALKRQNVFGYPPTMRADGSPNRPSKSDIGYAPLFDILTSQFATDAHIAAYSNPEEPYRLNTGAESLLDRGVCMSLFIFEVDCPKKQRDPQGKASQEWRDAEAPKIHALQQDQPGVIAYYSRGGYRLLGWLPEPMFIKSLDDSKAWAEFYVLFGTALHRKYGILTDPKCRNWHRLQRCPKATREDGVPEPGEFVGDPAQVGEWNLAIVDQTADKAHLETLKGQTDAWSEARDFVLSENRNFDVGSRKSSVTLARESYQAIIGAVVPEIAQITDGRHTLYLALAGTLIYKGFPVEDLPQLIFAISTSAGTDGGNKTRDRVAAARSTISRHLSGQPYAQIGTLKKYWPEVWEALDPVLTTYQVIKEPRPESSGPEPEDEIPLPELDTGSDSEIAEHILAARKKCGKELVYSSSKFWGTEPQKVVWQEVNRLYLEAAARRYDGLPCGKTRWKAQISRVRGAVSILESVVFREDFFENATSGTAFQNGFLRIENGITKFEELTPEHRATMQMPWEYDEAAECPKWLETLGGIFQPDSDADERIAFLQEFFGACLVGVAPKYQASLVLYGPTAENGKSTILEVISALFPSHVRASVAPQKMNNEYYVAALLGIRLNVVSEMPKTDVESSELFKAVISGDPITGRPIREKPVTFRPIAGHIFAANELPGTGDHTNGFWRRFIPVCLSRKFTPEDRIPGLAEKIIEEEMPGITNWVIEGARRLTANGKYAIPQSCVDLREAWRFKSDQVALFATACLEPIDDANKWMPENTVYSLYKAWSEDNGHRPMSSNKFSTRLESLEYRFRTVGGLKEWHVTFRTKHKDLKLAAGGFAPPSLF